MSVLGVRIGSMATRQVAGVAAVALPLIACVAVLAWRGVADPVDGHPQTEEGIARNRRVQFRLLEQTPLGIEEIAHACGLGSGALLRHHFRRVVGVTPVDYRRSFSCAE